MLYTTILQNSINAKEKHSIKLTIRVLFSLEIYNNNNNNNKKMMMRQTII